MCEQSCQPSRHANKIIISIFFLKATILDAHGSSTQVFHLLSEYVGRYDITLKLRICVCLCVCACVCSIIYALFADIADILLRLLKSAVKQDREREIESLHVVYARVLPHMYIGCCMCGVVLGLPTPFPLLSLLSLFFLSLSLHFS